MKCFKLIVLSIIWLVFEQNFAFGKPINSIRIQGKLIDVYHKNFVQPVIIKLKGVGETLTDANGNFSFELSDILYRKELALSTNYPSNDNYAVPKCIIQWDSIQTKFNVALYVLPCFIVKTPIYCYGRQVDYRYEGGGWCHANDKYCTNHKVISRFGFFWKPEQLSVPQFEYVAPRSTVGDEAMIELIERHIKYPESARFNGIQGKGIVGVVINKKGEVTSAFIQRNYEPVFDQEIVRTIKYLPKFKPALNANGTPIDCLVYLPFGFVLG